MIEAGRDHHIPEFSVWSAGDAQQMHVNDLHATMLRLAALTTNGSPIDTRRDFRLTDVFGKVAEGIVA